MKLAEKINKLLEEPRPTRSKSRMAPPSGVDVLKNNDQVFKLRREVIDMIHLLKKVDKDLPRIRVRITDNSVKSGPDKNAKVLGVAFTNKDSIFIDSDAVAKTNNNLFLVVAHEIIHATYGVIHVAGKTDIMSKMALKGKSDKWVLTQFKTWMNRYKNGDVKDDGYINNKGELIKWI